MRRVVILSLIVILVLTSCLPKDETVYITGSAISEPLEEVEDVKEVKEIKETEDVEEVKEIKEIVEEDINDFKEEKIEEEKELGLKKYLYVFPDRHDEIFVIDPAKKGIQEKIKVGTNPYDLLVDGRYAYVSVSTSDKILVINLKDNEIITEFETYDSPKGLAMNKEFLYSTSYPDRIQIWNKSDFSLVDIIVVGENPTDIILNGDNMYVTNTDDDSISVVNLKAMREMKTIRVEDYPTEMALVGKYLYVINQRSDSLLKIDTTKDEIVKDFKLRFGSRPVSIMADGRTLYISMEGSGYVGVHSDIRNKFIKEEKVGRSIVSTKTYLDDYLFVADKGSDYISIVEKDSFKLVNRYLLNKKPQRIFVVEK